VIYKIFGRRFFGVFRSIVGKLSKRKDLIRMLRMLLALAAGCIARGGGDAEVAASGKGDAVRAYDHAVQK